MPYNAGSLISTVQYKLQNHPRFTQAIVLDGLNRAVEKVVLYASEDDDVYNVLNPLSTDPTEAGLYALEFPLPPQTLYVNSISFDGRPLKRLTEGEWVQAKYWTSPTHPSTSMPSISLNTRDPTWYYIRANAYLNIYPRPDRQAQVQLYGVFKPNDMVNTTDAVPLNRQYSDALVSYACYWCTQGLPGPQETQRSADFLALYTRQVAEAKFNMTQNTEHRIARAR